MKKEIQALSEVVESYRHLSTAEYFKGNQFSVDAFNKKYALFEGETYPQAVKRVCDYVASVEKTEALRQYWSLRWQVEILEDWWHPAGSIMQGAACGRKISLANCTYISLGTGYNHQDWDNLESIIRNTGYTIAKCAAYRQGLGVDFSRLRPVGTKVLNSSNSSSGATHWMKLLDSLGYYVGQKGRIPAFLFSLSIRHPDVIEFIKTKADFTKIQNANISIQVTDDFYDAVSADKDWEMTFEVPEIKVGDRIYLDEHSATVDCLYDEGKKQHYYIARHSRERELFTRKIKARELLEQIAKHMHEFAEPGIQNMDIARRYSNSDYVYDPKDSYDSRIQGTNACSEQYLSDQSLCVLASINAEHFSIHPAIYEEELRKIGHSINRFLDNVNECEIVYHTYAMPRQKEAIEKLRRTGAGITNLAGWLFKRNCSYGSEEGNASVEKLTERYTYYLYESSIALGKEKGNFGLFNREKIEKSPFIKQMMKLGLTFSALRNVTVSSVAPTGSLSLMFRETVMSYGIEPAFGMYYWKRTRISGKYEYYFCIPAIVRRVFAEAGYPLPMESDTIKDTWDGKAGKAIVEHIKKYVDQTGVKFKDATEVSCEEKLKLMSRVTKWIDSSISVTYMLPTTASWKSVYNFILDAHKHGLKSITVFPDKKMYGIIAYVPFKELAISLVEEGVTIHEQNFTKDEAEQLAGVCNEKFPLEIFGTTKKHIVKTDAPKRPKTLPCDIHHIKVVKRLDKARIFDYMVLVGLYENEPYEIFAVEKEEGFTVRPEWTRGLITKEARGNYSLTVDGTVVLKNIAKSVTSGEEIVTRLTSTALRHGADISFILAQLEKTEGDMRCFTKSIGRALKRYVPDGTRVSGVSCANCGSNNLVRTEGCITCGDCGASKCS